MGTFCGAFLNLVCLTYVQINRLIVLKESSKIRTSVEYSNDAFTLQKQYRDALKLAENMSAFSKRVQYAHYRPNRSIKEDRKGWWHYVYTAVSEDQKKARSFPHSDAGNHIFV